MSCRKLARLLNKLIIQISSFENNPKRCSVCGHIAADIGNYVVVDGVSFPLCAIHFTRYVEELNKLLLPENGSQNWSISVKPGSPKAEVRQEEGK